MKSDRHISAMLFFLVFFLGVSMDAAQAQETGKVVSCNDCMVPRKEIKGKLVGQEDCKMMEVELTIDGRKYQRVDM